MLRKWIHGAVLDNIKEPDLPVVRTPSPSAEDFPREGHWAIDEEIDEEHAWIAKPWVTNCRLRLMEGDAEVELQSVVGVTAYIRDGMTYRKVNVKNLVPIRPSTDKQEVIAWRGTHEGKRFKVISIENGLCETRPIERLGAKLKKNESWTYISERDLIVAFPVKKKK